MALPATGATISMSDLRNFFVSEGQASSYILGILGTYIGISQGNIISMSSSFGGLGSSSGTFSVAKEFNVLNMRIVSGPPNLQELGGQRHNYYNDPECGLMHIAPNGTSIYWSSYENSGGGCQFKLQSPYTLGNATVQHSFIEGQSTFPGNMNFGGLNVVKLLGLGWNNQGTGVWSILNETNSIYLAYYTVATPYDLNTANYQHQRKVLSYPTAQSSDIGNSQSLTQFRNAFIEPYTKKLYLLARTLNGTNWKVYQYSYGTYDGNPGTNTNSATFTFETSIDSSSNLAGWFAITGNRMFLATSNPSVEIKQYNLSTDYDLQTATYAKSSSAGATGGMGEKSAGGTVSLDGSKIFYSPEKAKCIKMVTMSTPGEIDTIDNSGVDYTGGGTSWYPMWGHTGSAGGASLLGYQDAAIRFTTQGNQIYHDYTDGKVVGIYNSSNNTVIEIKMDNGWDLSSVNTATEVNAHNWANGSGNSNTPYVVFAGCQRSINPNRQWYFSVDGSNNYNARANQSFSGSIVPVGAQPPSSSSTLTNLGSTSQRIVGAAYTHEWARAAEDNNASYLYALYTNVSGNNIMRRFIASASSSSADDTPSSFGSEATFNCDDRIINAGFDVSIGQNPNCISSPRNGSPLTSFVLRALDDNGNPYYREVMFYATQINALVTFSLNSDDMNAASFSYGNYEFVPRDASICGMGVDGRGENMFIQSWSGIMYNITFDD